MYKNILRRIIKIIIKSDGQTDKQIEYDCLCETSSWTKIKTQIQSHRLARCWPRVSTSCLLQDTDYPLTKIERNSKK